MIIWGKSCVKYLGLVSLGNDYRLDGTYKSGNDNRRTQDPLPDYRITPGEEDAGNGDLLGGNGDVAGRGASDGSGTDAAAICGMGT